MKIYILRHGTTEPNEKQLYCGWTDVPLSQYGRSELNELKKACIYPEIKGLRVYTSGMRRTEETLEILYGKIKHQIIEDFKEVNFGSFEMKSYEQLKGTPEYKSWLQGNNEMNVCPNGESGDMMKKRALKGLEMLIDQNMDALVICHGGIISSIMSKLFPGERQTRYQWQPQRGKGYAITFCNGEPEGYEEIPG